MPISILFLKAIGGGQYADGYMEAAVALAQKSLEYKTYKKRQKVEKYIYPVLFLFHHHLELRLKNIIFESGQLLDENENYSTHHNILEHWKIAKKRICEVNKGAETSPIEAVEKIIKEMDSIDKTAMGYRYPITKNGDANLQNVEQICMRNLITVMKNVNSFFESVTMQISCNLDFKKDIESEFRN